MYFSLPGSVAYIIRSPCIRRYVRALPTSIPWKTKAPFRPEYINRLSRSLPLSPTSDSRVVPHFPSKRCEAWNFDIRLCRTNRLFQVLSDQGIRFPHLLFRDLKEERSTLSNFSSYAFTAVSPCSRTSSNTVRTVSNKVVTSNAGAFD